MTPVKGNEKRRKRKIGGRDDECFEMSCRPIKEKESGVDGFTDAVKRRGGKKCQGRR